jgi:hypothetical protein
MKKQTFAHVVGAFSGAIGGASALASRNATLFRVSFFMMLWAVLTLVLVADLFVKRTGPLISPVQASQTDAKPAPAQHNLLALGPSQ